MKNVIIKLLIATIVCIGLTGCGPKLANGQYSNSDSLLKENSQTKVYFEDINKDSVLESNKKIVEDFNKSEIVPEYWFSCKDSSKPVDVRLYTSSKNDSKRKIEGIKLVLSEDGMSINMIPYPNSLDKFNDNFPSAFFHIRNLLKDISNKNKYMTANFYISGKDSKEYSINIYNKRSFLYKNIGNDIKKQIELGGWQMVDSPEKADKEIYYEITRDYSVRELKELKKQQQGIKLTFTENGNKFNTSTANYNNGSHIIVGQSAMSAASSSNGSLLSAAIGLGASAVFSTFGSTPDDQVTGSFVSLKIVDKKFNKEHIKLFQILVSYDQTDKSFLMGQINNSVNRFADGAMFDINK